MIVISDSTARRSGAGAGMSQQLRDRWGISVIVLTWSWLCVPKIIQTLLSPKYRVTLGGEAPYSRIAALSDKGLYYALIGLCVLVLIVFLNDLPRSGGLSLLLILLPWIYMVLRDLYVLVRPTEEAIVYLLIALALFVIRPRFRTLAVLGYLAGGTAALSVLIAVGLPSHAIYQTQDGELYGAEKALLPIGILVGIFTQGNILGQFMCLTLPTVFLIRHTGHRRVLATASIVALVWSASRGALITAGVGLIVYLIVARGTVGLRRLVAWSAPTVLLLVISIVPFLTTDARAFSNRGILWTISLREWTNSPWTGFGINWYDVIGRSSSRISGSARHGHNQLVQLLVTGGIIMAVLVALQFGLVISRSVRMSVGGRQYGVVWVTMLAMSGLFERTVAYVDNASYFVSVVVPLIYLAYSAEAVGTMTKAAFDPAPRMQVAPLLAPSIGSVEKRSRRPE